MTTPARIPSAVRNRHVLVIASILLALQALGSVTTYEASRYLDLYDPRARKKELCKEGHAIDTIAARVVTESGEVHRIGRYVLKGFTLEKAA